MDLILANKNAPTKCVAFKTEKIQINAKQYGNLCSIFQAFINNTQKMGLYNDP